MSKKGFYSGGMSRFWGHISEGRVYAYILRGRDRFWERRIQL